MVAKEGGGHGAGGTARVLLIHCHYQVGAGALLTAVGAAAGRFADPPTGAGAP